MTARWRAPSGLHFASARLPDEGELPAFDGAAGWLNSPPLTPAGLRGQVVLVDFWTYTCINWLRQLPYLRAWAGKYSGHGLVVIGVHTPEFSFEHDADNVRQAARDMGITYPVATDNNYGVWQARRGGSGTVPARLGLNQWALAGEWTMGEEAATLNAAGGQIACRFHARDLNLVMGQAIPGTSLPFRVRIDGQPPGEAHGTDTGADGTGSLTQQRVHQLIRQPGPITERTFEITFDDPGAQAYCFTFG